MNKPSRFLLKVILVTHRRVVLALTLATLWACAQSIAFGACPSGGEQLLPVQGVFLITGGLQKCSFPEFTNVNPCEVKYYLKQTTHAVTSTSVVYSNYTTEPYSDNSDHCPISYGVGLAYSKTDKSYDATQTTTYNSNCELISDIFNGSQSYNLFSHDYRTNSKSCGSYAHSTQETWVDDIRSDVLSGTLDNSGWAISETTYSCLDLLGHWDNDSDPDPPLGNSCSTNSYTATTPPSVNMTGGDELVTPTLKTITASLDGGSSTTTIKLETEFTTCDLIGKGIEALNAQDINSGAYWDQMVVGSLINQRTRLKELDRARYWFSYQTEVGKSYQIKKYYTVVSAGCALPDTDVSETTLTETVTGDGHAHTETNDILPVCVGDFVGYKTTGGDNSSDITLGGKAELTMVVLSKVTISQVGTPCASCGHQRVGAAGLQLTQGKAMASFNLGVTQLAQPVGLLQLEADSPSASLSTIQALQVLAPSNLVTFVTNASDGSLRQVGATECLVDVQTIDPYQYRLIFYPTNAFAPGSDHVTPQSTNGLTPLVSWLVLNPDGATTNNRLQVIEFRGAQPTTNQFVRNSALHQWQLDQGNGLSRTLITEISNSTFSNRTETVQTVNPATGQVIAQTVSTYQLFRWGEGLVQQVIGTGPSALTNTYTYYEVYIAGYRFPGSGRLLQAVHGDGTWERYEYDGQGRISKITIPYGNTTPDDPDGLTRIQEYSYEPWTGYGDDPSVFPLEPRSIKETLSDGTLVSKKFFLASGNMTVRSQTSNYISSLGPFDPGNPCTTNWYYSDGDTNAMRLQRVDHPDGTMELYTYTNTASGATNIVYSGQPNSTRTTVVDGTKTITHLGHLGETLSTHTIDIISNITTSLEIYGNFDLEGRASQVTHLDGTSESMNYDCCHLISQTDRDGTLTTYTYDDLKRMLTTTRNGITTSNIYDGANNLISTVRFGTNGGAITLSSSVFDDARRKLISVDALNHTNYYTNFFNGTGQTRQTTYADGSTRIDTYAADGSLMSVSGTAVSPVNYFQGSEYPYPCSLEVKLSATGDTNEWVKTYQDTLGRSFKTVYASASGSPTSISYYNDLGQLTNTVDPDGVSTLYAYNLKGEQAYTILDTNRDYNIDFAGDDRIIYTTNDVVNSHGYNVRRSRTYEWSTSADISTLISTKENSVDGLRSWSTIWNNGLGITSSNVTVYAGSGFRYMTNIAPDGSFTVSTYHYGELLSTARKDANGNPLGQITYGYDAHGRQAAVTNAATGTTTFSYNNADQVISTTTPAPAPSQSAQTTLTFYDNMNRVAGKQLPDGTTTTNLYYLSGLLKLTYGSRTYPVGYSYDAQGRMTKMTNWTSFSGNAGARVTTWNYDPYRGFLTNKVYDGGVSGPSYTYTDGGRIATRLWARGITTTYSYNTLGELSSVTYDDGVTPGVRYDYDRLGHQTGITTDTSACTLAYNDAGLVLSEEYTTVGSLDILSVTNGYDSLLRRTSNALLRNSTLLTLVTNNYDAASRLLTISDRTNSATYSYLTNSSLVSQIAFTNNGVLRMTTMKTYDNLKRLTSTKSTDASSIVLDSHAYPYNSANQRTSVTNADNARWVYQYDNLGQVISGNKYWSDGTPVAGQQFQYAFDDIGNRTSSEAGGNEIGTGLRHSSYTVNSRNQYTSRTITNLVDIFGSALSNATVTVNNQQAYRKNDYFRKELAVTNNSGPVWLSITNLAVLNNGTNADTISSVTGHLFVPLHSESFTYDADGNLTSDGRWTNHWDAENRLISMESLTNGPAGSKLKLLFGYDYMGRRISKTVSNWTGSAWALASDQRFVYDGWNLIATLTPALSVQTSFVWGLDLSGTMQGAGGIGGLLAISQLSPLNSQQFVSYDGNGNVVALVDASNSTLTGQYEYGPFAEPLRATGSMAKTNPFRFSTKYQDDESGLLYYGYRYYNPLAGRWLGRDRLEERGGLNTFGFVRNDPLGTIDLLGNEPWQIELRAQATGTLIEMIAKTASSSLVKSMQKHTGIGKLLKMVDKVSWIPYSGTPQYQWHAIYIEVPMPPSTLAHELVHAYNDIMNTGLDEQRDEGVASAFEGLLGAANWAKNMEDFMNEQGYCEAAGNGTLEKEWRQLWKFYGNPNVYPPAFVSIPYNGLIQSPLDAQDFRNLKSIFGFHLSCKEMAAIINSRLGRCCFVVTCNEEATQPFEIPAGIKINPVFQ